MGLSVRITMVEVACNMLSFQFFLENSIATLLCVFNVFVKLFHHRLRNSLIRAAKLPSSCFLVDILARISHSLIFDWQNGVVIPLTWCIQPLISDISLPTLPILAERGERGQYIEMTLRIGP